MNFRIDINQDDIDRLTRGFELAVQAQSSRTLEHLADVAVSSLSSLDRKLNHLALADMWTHTPVLPDDDGGLSVTVFSEAESMVFFNMTGSAAGRVRSDRHYIQGENLLEILEGGARAHFIFPSEASILTLPGPDGGTLFRQQVAHPGVQANENVKQTGELIENGLDQVANEAAQAISVEMA